MNKNPENKIALIYCRVSSVSQATEGSGLDSQEQRCRQYCARKGYVVEKVFRDSFTGGGDFARRPGMSELLRHADEFPYKKYVLVFDDLSRVARDVQFHLKLKEAFKTRGITSECLNFNFDDTPEGDFAETIAAASNELVRKQNRRQVVQKMLACLEMGRLPFGCKKIGYERVINPITRRKMMAPSKDAPFVKEALEGFAYKRFARRIDVARFLQKKGVLGKADPEKYLNTINSILKDVFHAGFIEYPAWEFSKKKGEHEALISMEVFELNQKRLNGEVTGKRVRSSPNPDFAVVGLVNCAGCGKTLRAYMAKGKFPYYECKTKDCQFRGKTIRRQIAEDGFNEIITSYRPKNGLVEVATEIYADAWAEELREAKAGDQSALRQKTDLEKEIEVIAKQAGIAGEDTATGRQLAKILETKAMQLEKLEEATGEVIDYGVPYRTALERVLGTLRKPLEMWLAAYPPQRRQLFFFFFEERLAFAAGEGYRTAKLSPILRLFERFDGENSVDVEMGGVGPPCKDEGREPSTNVV